MKRPPRSSAGIVREMRGEYRFDYRRARPNRFAEAFGKGTPAAAEQRAIRRGRAAFARGDYVSLDELRDELGTTPRRPRKKSA